jgi:prepilin-type N-terminal cleavage/methylation domain-containing protein
MKNKISKMKGFTLVELLIVIALIAILSVAVLATINPIEQSNKARDAAQKNDAAEVLSAYERYYTTKNAYPWGSPENVGTTVIASNDANFGVVDGSGGNGVLVSTSELKSSFAAKSPFTSAPKPIDMMYIYNNGSDANYVCYVPKARANRSLLGLLRCVSQPDSSTDGSHGVQSPGENGCASVAADSTDWTQDETYLSATQAFFLCVPETAAVDVTTPTPTP